MYTLDKGVIKTKRFFSVTAVMVSVAAVVISGLPAALFSSSANALAAPGTVYDSLPGNITNASYVSEAFEATSTSEFGDYIHLGGTNRTLNDVTVTMVDWAKYSDYSSNPTYSGDSTSWSLPMTLNVYDNTFDSNGTPTHKIATVTQNQSIRWRPESDPSCSNTSNGKGWKIGDVCYNNSGIASNVTFDLSSQNVTLPDDIVVTVAFDTQAHGYNPTHEAGPYDSLNVAIPENQTVSVGSDNDTDGTVVNASWAGGYSGNSSAGDGGPIGILRKSTTWAPYGTVAMQVTATTPPTVSACTTTSTVNSTSLSGWDLTQTRADGHNQLLADGLHVYTDDNSSNAKAAGYYPVDFPLSGLGDQTIAQSFDYTTNSGSIAPGLQLAVDFDHDGTPDGYLVGESIYGNDWWLSGAAQFVKDSAPHDGGGYGSAWYGTPNEWLAAFPDAQVKAIGYSLGSGVQGDYTIHHITLGCTDYTFSMAAPSLIAPANDTTVNGASITNSWSSVEGAAKYEYQSFSDAAGHNLRYDGTFATTSKTAINVTDGTVFYWRVRAIDSTGAAGPWSNNGGLWKVTVDSSRPSTPTLLTPGNGTYKNTNDFYFTWTDSSDTGSPVTYEFISSQNGHANNGVLDTNIWDNIASGNSGQKNLTSPTIHSTGAGDGTWYWQVRAIDAAGNKSDWSSIYHVTIDTKTPAVPTNLSWKDASNHTVANNGYTNTYSGTAGWQDSSNDVDHYIYKYWNDIPSSPYQSEATAYTAAVSGTSLSGVFNQGEGVHHFCVEAVDAAGNTSVCSAAFTVTYDSTAPDAQLTAPTDSIVRGTVIISGTVTDTNPDHYYLVVKDSHGHVVAGPGTVNAAAVADYTWNTTSLADGTYTIDLEARDAANNKDSGSVDTKTVTVDNNAPDVSIDSYNSSGNVITPVVTATDPAPGTALTYSWAPNDTASTDNVIISDDTILEPDFTVTADGTYAFTLTVTDAAGNSTAKTFNFTYAAPGLNSHSIKSFAVHNTSGGRGSSGGAGSFTNVTTGNPGGGGGQVLGAATNTPSTISDNSDSSNSSDGGHVKGAATENLDDSSSKSSDFLGLGWWWLPVFVILSLIIGGLLRRAGGTDTPS